MFFTRIGFRLPLCLSLVLALGSIAVGQEERDQTTPTGWLHYYNIDQASLLKVLPTNNATYRVFDIEIVSTSPLRYDVIAVRNSGVYAKTSSWFSGLTASALAFRLSNTKSYLIDIEPYAVGSNLYFAGVLAPRGSRSTAYATGLTSTSTITSYLSNGWRLQDWDQYTFQGKTYHAVSFIKNTGSDKRTFWALANQSSAQILANMIKGWRPVDIDPLPNGNFNVTMHAGKDGTWFYAAKDFNTLMLNVRQNGARMVDVERYRIGSRTYFAAIMVRNGNTLENRVGDLIRSRTNGSRGFFLKEINGGTRAWLMGDFPFEPASLLKTLHHVHAMRQVASNNLNLNWNTTTYLGKSGSCPTWGGSRSTESWATVLTLMMRNSDNCRTRRVSQTYGFAAFNSTAKALGMTQSKVNHHIGCGTPANTLTLDDLYQLHRGVRNGYLGSERDTFYNIMLSWTSYPQGPSSLSTMVNQEAAKVGVTGSSLIAFRAAIRMAWKPGGYGVANKFYRSHGGWLRLPFVINGKPSSKEYVTGAFVHGATNENNAINASSAAAVEVLRDEVRAALTSWKGYTPGFYQIYGSGCRGSNGQTPELRGVGTPEINSISSAAMSKALPNTLVLLFTGLQSQSISLNFMGATSCRMYTDVTYPYYRTTNGSGNYTLSFLLPNQRSLVGVNLYTQFFAADKNANRAGFTASNAVRTFIGGKK